MNDLRPSGAERPTSREPAGRWLAVVPTLGRSRHLVDSVAALRREGGRVWLVAPRDVPLDASTRDDDGVVVVPTDGALGFAAANRAGLAAAADAELVALVNDDAVVAPGWAGSLVAELDAHPEAGAAQGTVLRMDDGGDDLVDGAGLAWNRWWQAVQRGHGLPAPTAGPSVEVFGVSATAAIYRRRALDQVGLFDERLGSYYEDVDLAVRLRAAGWTARLVPSARARHAGSLTGRDRGAGRLVRRNRYAVLARALGLRFLPRLPWTVLRDALDGARALGRADLASFAAIASGTVAGLATLPGTWLAPGGRAGLLATDELRRWSA